MSKTDQVNFDKLEWQRNQRKKDGNTYTNKYEKTKSGFLMRKYRNMESRITGVQYLKAHLYEGLSILDRQDFYAWALADPEFHRLFLDWELSAYDRRLTPSINRIDSSEGYEIHNIEWITHSENSRLGAAARHRGQYVTA